MRPFSPTSTPSGAPTLVVRKLLGHHSGRFSLKILNAVSGVPGTVTLWSTSSIGARLRGAAFFAGAAFSVAVSLVMLISLSECGCRAGRGDHREAARKEAHNISYRSL